VETEFPVHETPIVTVVFRPGKCREAMRLLVLRGRFPDRLDFDHELLQEG
jgi:hypothetical protein